MGGNTGERGGGLVNLSELWQRAISKILYHVISFGAATLLCHRLWPTSIGLNSLYCPLCPSLSLAVSLSLLNCNIQFELNEQVEILLLHCHSLFFFCQVSVLLSLPPYPSLSSSFTSNTYLWCATRLHCCHGQFNIGNSSTERLISVHALRLL